MCRREWCLSWLELRNLLINNLPKLNPAELRPLDTLYWYTSLESWHEIFWNVAKNMPRYLVDRFDCDDFAFVTAYRITDKYKLNGCRVAMGPTPFGYHAWNIFVAGEDEELFYYEPQTGEIAPVLENSLRYEADRLVI